MNNRTVKKEKQTQPEDSEYDEWARKLVERQTPQIGVLQNAAGGNAAIFGGQQVLTSEGIPANCGFDKASAIGRFTWATIAEDKFIPVLFRDKQEYVSIKMAEISVIGELLNVLPVELYESIKISAYYATAAEAKVLTYINSWHCDGFYGSDVFTQFDLIISLDDLKRFYDFLYFGFSVLHSGGKNIDSEYKHCGFVRVNSDSLIPYTVLESGERGVPLFYFEGQTEVLKAKAQPLGGWPLAYLKICCKVQGVRKDLISNPTLQIVTLADLQAYFPKRTTFAEKCWPLPKPKSLLPKQVLSGIMQSTNSTTLVAVASERWTKVEVNDTYPNYRPSPPLSKSAPNAATISQAVVNTKNGSSSTVMLSVNGVRTNREIPKNVQSRSPALAKIKISSRPGPVDKAKLALIPEHPDGGKDGAYVVRLIVIENTFMHCINSKAGRTEDYLVLLQEFMEALFPSVSIYPTAVSLLRNQEIITYLPNAAQIRTLNNFGFQLQEGWQVPLISASEAQNAVPKLRSIINKPRTTPAVVATPPLPFALATNRRDRVSNGSSSYGSAYPRR